MTRGRRRALGALAVATAILVTAAPAAAVEHRYVSPTGSGTACSSGSPCSLQQAFTSQSDGQEVIIAPGDYGPISADLNSVSNAYIHGVQGQPRPRIHMAPAHFVTINSGARLSWVQIDGSATDNIEVNQASEADQIEVDATDGSACLGYGTLIDSICSASGEASKAIEGGIGGGSYTPLLRNVTAEATGPDSVGIDYSSESNGHFDITAVNLIAHGQSADIIAEADALPATTVLTIDHSNYVNGEALGAGAMITPTARQTAAPAFVDAGARDFHQAPGSPTIDAGVTGSPNGSLDVYGLPRVMGASTDIGAAEYDPFAGVMLAQQSTKVKKRKATIAITCPAGVPSPCQGTLTLSFRQKKKTLTAGSSAFSIPSGAAGSASLAISKKAAKRLAKKGKLATQATATATDGAGKSGAVSATVKLKQKKRKGKR
jgi:hypothetical protein